MHEDKLCVEFHKSCNIPAMKELRKKCPVVRKDGFASALFSSAARECIDKARTNFYVDKYYKSLKIEENKRMYGEPIE